MMSSNLHTVGGLLIVAIAEANPCPMYHYRGRVSVPAVNSNSRCLGSTGTNHMRRGLRFLVV